MLNFFLNKGGAGASISRQETVERLNPLIRQHYVLNHGYDHAIRTLRDRGLAERLEEMQWWARADIGKLAETVFSAGGTAYNGTDLEPDHFNLGDDEDELLFQLRDLESNFLDQVLAEGDVEHHIRTRAVLDNVRAHSEERLALLKDLTRRRRRKAVS